jgi:hypothetical protein
VVVLATPLFLALGPPLLEVEKPAIAVVGLGLGALGREGTWQGPARKEEGPALPRLRARHLEARRDLRGPLEREGHGAPQLGHGKLARVRGVVGQAPEGGGADLEAAVPGLRGGDLRTVAHAHAIASEAAHRDALLLVIRGLVYIVYCQIQAVEQHRLRGV